MPGRSQVNLKPNSRICSGKNMGLEIGQNLDLNSGLSIVSGAIVSRPHRPQLMIKEQTSVHLWHIIKDVCITHFSVMYL